MIVCLCTDQVPYAFDHLSEVRASLRDVDNEGLGKRGG